MFQVKFQPVEIKGKVMTQINPPPTAKLFEQENPKNPLMSSFRFKENDNKRVRDFSANIYPSRKEEESGEEA